VWKGEEEVIIKNNNQKGQQIDREMKWENKGERKRELRRGKNGIATPMIIPKCPTARKVAVWRPILTNL
jgi:hypothetical protein